MKKLSITKEAFEKSKYFTGKYGKLEYVSESGKLFKTNKGKILMFKESNTAKKPMRMVKEGLFSDLGDELDSGISKVRKFFHGKPKFKKGDCVMLCMIEWSPCGISHGNIVSKVQWEDKKWYYEFEDGEYGDSWPEDALAIDPDPEAGYEELNPKALIEKYPEFIKRARTILGKKKCKELGIDESTKKFVKESCDEEFDRYYERMKKIFRYDSGIHIRLRDNEDGSETIEVTFDDRFNWDDDVVSGSIPLDEDSLLLDWITRLNDAGHRNGWEFDYEIAKDIEHPIDGGANNDYLAMLTLTCKCDNEEDDLLFENSSKSGKVFKTNKGKFLKFKESFNKDDYKNRPKDARPKFDIGDVVDLNWDFYYNMNIEEDEVPSKGWDIEDVQEDEDGDGFKYYVSNDDLDYGYWVYEYEIQRARLPRKFRESPKKFGKKFKESVGDVSTDPAYVCPYCGSRNCEFDDAEDLGSGLQEGYFEGATFNAQFWCNECNKPYNVTYELKVKDVYPNEGADELSDDWV